MQSSGVSRAGSSGKLEDLSQEPQGEQLLAAEVHVFFQQMFIGLFLVFVF